MTFLTGNSIKYVSGSVHLNLVTVHEVMILTLFSALWLLTSHAIVSTAKTRQPHIVFIVADDLGKFCWTLQLAMDPLERLNLAFIIDVKLLV